MLVRKAVPVSLWQSAQWQTLTVAGSTSASYVICPQWHTPVTFIVFSVQIPPVACKLGRCQDHASASAPAIASQS
jgi:hypothetical protein